MDAPAVDDTPRADASLAADLPLVADAPAAADAPVARDVPGVTCAPGDCGPNGRSHGDHCDCDEGFVERDGCCVPPPPCSGPDDELEENDSPAEATPVPATGASYESLRHCPADSDMFAIPLARGQRVEVRATFTHARGDIDLYLFRPNTADPGHARPVARSNGSANNERIAYTATEDGAYLLWVTGYNGAENAYGLSVQITTP